MNNLHKDLSFQVSQDGIEIDKELNNRFIPANISDNVFDIEEYQDIQEASGDVTVR